MPTHARLLWSDNQWRKRHKVENLFGRFLSGIFGRNRRAILHGLVDGRPAAGTLTGLTSNLRPKVARLARHLEAELDAHSLWRLRGLLDACDSAAQRIADLDPRAKREVVPVV